MTCPRCGLSGIASTLELCPRCLLESDAEEQPAAPPGIALEGELGRGGMGRVFRARHVRLDRLVAVKFLPVELSFEPSFRARFEREARTLAKLNHPNIVQVHDFGTSAEGDSYLIMELVAHGTLRTRLPLTVAAALRVLADVCAGLAYAHARGIVHRDVKPENVLFDEEGRAKIGDFGLARLIEQAPSHDSITRPLEVLGTPGYVAPEARAGLPPDPRMDVFAAGTLLHVMLTGRLPDAELGAIPEALRPIVRRAISIEPSARYPSALELGQALSPHLGAPRPEPARAVALAAPPRLPIEEESWMRAVALTFTGATALSLYALVVSLSPRVMPSSEMLSFVVFGVERLPGDKVFSRARFETGPTLAAALGWAFALGAYGVLRSHWRRAGIERHEPERKLAETRSVLVLAGVVLALFVVRILLERAGFVTIGTYVPVVGGVLETAVLYTVWLAILESRRTARALTREPLLWLGLTVSLVPPVLSFIRLLRGEIP